MSYDARMGLSRTILAAGVLVFLLGCGHEEPDRVVVVSAHGSQSNTTTTGGGTVVVTSSGLTVSVEAWSFAEPSSFSGRIPPVRLTAIGDAMFRVGADAEVVDALRTDRGTVALVRKGRDRLLLCHFEEERSACSLAPEGSRRLLTGTNDPFTVRLLVADDLAVTATRNAE